MNKYNYQTRFCEHNPADNGAKYQKCNATAMFPIRASIIRCLFVRVELMKICVKQLHSFSATYNLICMFYAKYVLLVY